VPTDWVMEREGETMIAWIQIEERVAIDIELRREV